MGRTFSMLFFSVMLCVACREQAGSTPQRKDDLPIPSSSRPHPNVTALPVPPLDSATFTKLDCAIFTDSVFASPLTREDLKRYYGAPDSLHAVVESNRHDPAEVDSIFNIYYPELRVRLRTPRRGNDLVEAAVTTSNRYLRYPSIGIGAPVERLSRILGKPTTSSDERWTYDCGSEVEEPVALQIVQRHIRRVSKTFYVD